MESIPFVTPVGLVEGDAVINVLKGDADTNGSKDFIAFYADGFDRAARLAFLLTGDVSVSEDIAQEALSRLQPRFATIEFPSAS